MVKVLGWSCKQGRGVGGAKLEPNVYGVAVRKSCRGRRKTQTQHAVGDDNSQHAVGDDNADLSRQGQL